MREDNFLQSFQEGDSQLDTGAIRNAHDSPTQNRILAALPPRDYARLLGDLEPVALPLGWTIHGAGDPEDCLYFPTAGIVARLLVTLDGETAGFSVTGREGVIGIASFLGAESTPSQAMVLSEGRAYRLAGKPLKRAIEGGGALPHLLLRYTQALLAQIGQTAVCNRHHSMEQQLSCWILANLDRLPTNELTMTQTLIAEMLGVRRESITHAAGGLQDAGLIRYSRGRIIVLDRAGLERRTCECYAVVKREFDRLLRPPEKQKSPVGNDWAFA